jgi:hypothetical protein
VFSSGRAHAPLRMACVFQRRCACRPLGLPPLAITCPDFKRQHSPIKRTVLSTPPRRILESCDSTSACFLPRTTSRRRPHLNLRSVLRTPRAPPPPVLVPMWRSPLARLRRSPPEGHPLVRICRNLPNNISVCGAVLRSRRRCRARPAI